jgi:hypothetical protein
MEAIFIEIIADNSKNYAKGMYKRRFLNAVLFKVKAFGTYSYHNSVKDCRNNAWRSVVDSFGSWLRCCGGLLYTW